VGSVTDTQVAVNASGCMACVAGQYSNASAAACTTCLWRTRSPIHWQLRMPPTTLRARRVSTATHRQLRARCVWRARPRIRWQLLVPSAALRAQWVGTATHRQLRAQHVRQAPPRIRWQLLRGGSVQQRIGSHVHGMSGGLGHQYTGSCEYHQLHCVRGGSRTARRPRRPWRKRSATSSRICARRSPCQRRVSP
jgi:hypothetical protein